MNVYDFTVKDLYGNDVPLSKYRGKTLLIINSATTCFLTPQYQALQELYAEMKERDFEILDFPCDQFGEQAGDPLGPVACDCRHRYKVEFDQFAKLEVNGENASPLFKYLKQCSPFQGLVFSSSGLKTNFAYHTISKGQMNKSCDIRWNFTKFLVNKDGEVVARFEPAEPIEIVRSEVNRLLNGESLSIKKPFTRRAKDTRSQASESMFSRHIATIIFFFIFTYIVTFCLDLFILQYNGVEVFQENIIPGNFRIEELDDTELILDYHEDLDEERGVFHGLFADQRRVRKQVLLPLPGSIILTVIFIIIFRRNSKRINKLCNALEQASAGNFNYRLKTNEKDLFNRPFNDFNIMCRELKDTMESLEIAAHEADAANIAKSNFLSNMSHEIRTPLNAVLGMDEMILRESTEESILAYANDIKNAGKTLLSLINDILDFSKIEANKLEIIPVEYDLSSVLNDLINMTSPRASAKDLNLTFDVDPSMPHILYGDEIRIKQICTNIITNAVKYTDKGKITVSFKKAEVNGVNAIRFICQDTGQGISPEDIPKLTEPFARINEKKNRTIEGTGLGMSITTSLLASMDSRLELESTLGQGSTFSFTVVQPANNDEPIGNFAESYKKISTNSTYEESFHAPNAHILVVDDVEMNLTVAKSFLKKTLINVDTCTSGKQALELTKNNKYDIIFVDHMMPDMDGIDTLNAIRNSDCCNKETPIIVLTANAVSGAREKYLEAGFDNYLTKPIESVKLEHMIQSYLPNELIEKVSAEVVDDQIDDSVSTTITAIGQISGVDTAEGIKNSGGPDAYVSVVENFSNTASGRADLIDEYRKTNDIKNYTIQVHALKSSARLVGHMDLSNLAKQLEECGNSNDIETINEKTDGLLADYIFLAESLQKIFIKDSNLPLINSDMLKDAITTLYEALSVFDMDTADSIIDALNAYSMPQSFEDIYSKIKVAMSNVDRDTVISLIDNNKDTWR